jgi:hypothetical protein
MLLLQRHELSRLVSYSVHELGSSYTVIKFPRVSRYRINISLESLVSCKKFSFSTMSVLLDNINCVDGLSDKRWCILYLYALLVSASVKEYIDLQLSEASSP